ncbi:MAG: PQQ-binding-like beta-propeller repeat protein [Acidobacteriota bacterium]
MNFKHNVIVGLVFLGASISVLGQSRTADYTQWRGANRDGAAAGFTAPTSWPEKLTQRWKIEVGTGYATPLVVGNRLYLFSRQGDDEVMSALDPANGKVIWRTAYPIAVTMHPAATKHGPGPKSTPVFADGKLFSIGFTGAVTAFDAATGKQLWQKPGTIPLPFFNSHAFSPIVERGLVIFHTGGHMQGALTAFDVNTGAVKWSWAGDGPGYGSPVIAEFAGTRQLVTITQGKIVSVDPATGALLWERPYVSANFTNAVTPVVYGQTLIVSGNGGPTVAVAVTKQNNQWMTATAWENPDVQYRLSNSVLMGDTLFGLSSRNMGQYFGIDPKTGKTLWTSEPRQAGNAAIVYSGELAFSLEDTGELKVFRHGGTSFETVRRYTVADSETWTQPTIIGNRIFVKDVSNLTLWTLN